MTGRPLCAAKLLFGGLLALGGVILGLTSLVAPSRMISARGASVTPDDVSAGVTFMLVGLAAASLLFVAGVLVVVLTLVRENRRAREVSLDADAAWPRPDAVS